MPNGSFRKVDDTIWGESVMRKQLLAQMPADCWVSTGCFLNPQDVGEKGELPSANLFMFSQVAVESDYARLDYARKNTLKAWDWFEANGHKVLLCVFSGRRGFHLWSDWFLHSSFLKPQEREQSDVETRKWILTKMKSDGLKIDEPVFIDSRRIFRLPGSINSKTGYACKVLTKEEMEKPMEKILKDVPKVELPRVATSSGGMTGFTPLLVSKSAVRDQPSAPAHFFLTSVCGTDARQVVALRYTNLNYKAITRLQAEYRIGDVFILVGRWFWAVAPRTVDSLRRYSKILNHSGCDQAYAGMVKKLGYGFFEKEVTFREKIETTDWAGTGQCSRAHVHLLRKLGARVPNYPEVIGNMEVVERAW